MTSNSVNKELLITDIKKWISLDDEINKQRKALRDLNLQKKNTTTNLIKTMKEKQIDCFETNSGGTLVYRQAKSKQPITNKFLKETLNKIYSNSEKVDDIVNAIQENRAEITRDVLTRKKLKH
jgi:hypothetical protein